LLVSWPAFTTAQNQAVAAGSLSAAIGADGFVSVNLTPNAGALPAGSYYTVVYQLSDGTVNQEYWVVPAAGTAAVASVRAQLEPSTVAVQPTVTSQYVTSALSSMASGYLPLGGGTLSGPLMLNADPTAAGQAATKHYADQLSAAELPLSGGNVQGTVSTQMGIDKLPRVDVMHPDFAAGQPIKGIAVTNGSCTSNATIAISAPAYSQDGTQATAVGYCVNGTLKAYISFPGGGYTSAATVTITGGGTSGATGTVALVGAAGQADPSGTNDSSAAILNAVDYAQSYGESNAKGGTEPGATPLVYLPKGTYKLLDTVRVPCDLHLMGDGENATILEPATSNENALTLYAGAINAADAYVDGGSITNLAINAIGGHSYQATELELQSCAGNHYDHVRIYGGGGRGLQSAGPGAERQEASDIEIDSVRWPLLWLGNENHLRKLNIAAPGVSSDNYCWSIADCVNGVYPNYQWTGGTLVSANGNGTTSSFYVKGTYANGTSQSTSPLVVGHTFTVGGTGNLDGTYTVTAVTNNVASDPSGACTSSSQCFEVQAASSVSGNATLGESTTAAFTSGAYTMSVVSGLGFDPGAFVSGPGIPANTRVVASGGTTVTVNQAFTASESGSTVAAAAGWWPTLLPTSNAAATVSGANVVLDSGSIKSLWYAGAYDVEGVYGSRIQSFYLEGYPVNGIPTVNSDLRYGNLPPTTTLTGTLSQTVCNSQSEICPVSVASTQWFLNYLNDPMDIIGGQQGNTNFSTRLLPPDYIHGSTAASEVGNGVEKGQWEDVTGTFAGDGNLYITARDLSTSTAPAGTAWPAGTIVAFVPLPTASYGSLLFADNHAAAIDPPGAGWWYDCNDQGQNPCASWTMGSIPNELSSFTLGDYKTSAAYYPGLAGNVTFLDNEIWGSPFTPGDEPLGDAMIKVFGAGGRATVLNGTNTVAGSNAGYDATLDNGPLADGFWDPTAADGSCANAMYNNLDYNLTWTGGVKTGTCMLGGYSKEYTPTGTDSATGATIYTRVRQFGNSYCTYDTPGTVGGHATQRLCLFGGPGNSARLEWDTWSGSAWTPGLTSNSAGVTAVHLSLTGSLSAQGSVTGASINGEITVDGTTYTTLNAAWNAAVSQASATGKNQTIRLGPGTFAVSATLTEPANGACVSVLGSGGTTMNADSPQVATTLTVPASLNGDVFFLGNAAQAQGCTFRDLNLLAQANAT
ncbi:MAG: glycosyl hydrolase family 28-related protein, partial [Acidobacteriaceae bacterium]